MKPNMRHWSVQFGGMVRIMSLSIKVCGWRPSRIAAGLFVAHLPIVDNQLGLAADPAEAGFEGLIEQPSLRRDAELRAQWDFSTNIDQQTILDTISGRAGELVNVPMRGMRGSNWDGSEFNWRHAPEQYGAIHFHDNDLTDCKWESSVSFRIPAQLKSGIYALEVLSDLGHDTIPFFILPARGAPKKSIAVLASTFTYLASWHMEIMPAIPLKKSCSSMRARTRFT